MQALDCCLALLRTAAGASTSSESVCRDSRAFSYSSLHLPHRGQPEREGGEVHSSCRLHAVRRSFKTIWSGRCHRDLEIRQ